MKLCSYYGGSISYGLNTPSSDKDIRGLYLCDTISDILGLTKNDFKCSQNSTEDVFYWELRHFLNLLHKGNTMCLEMLYNNQWIECTDEFKYIQSFRNQLIDSHQLYKCLRGYCHSERALVLGERTGVLGSKRHEHLKTYGYSYKNAVQFLRLCLCGSEFFQTGNFPVNVRRLNLGCGDLLYEIKTHPEHYPKAKIIDLMDLFEKRLEVSYKEIKIEYKYNLELANRLCYELYMPILKEYETYE
jgi:predicted nucleotidyltransferase